MPTSPSCAGATIESALPSNSTASGEITDTLSIAGSALELLGVGDDVVDAAGHEERLLRQSVELAGDDALEARDGLLDLHVLAGDAGELLSDGERLRHEALDAARASDDALVVFRELVHTEDRDDVLQLLVALQNALHARRHVVVAFADELGVEDSRRRRQWIDGGIDAELRDRARKHDGRVQVGERGRRRRIGDVVGRHINGLHRRDRAVARRRDALLQVAHLRGQRRLIADGARHAAEERGHFRTGLGEAEDVVDEDEHVRVLLIAEVLGDGEAREADTKARAGRLVHLAVNERDLIENAGFFELQIEIVAFARTLADAAEDRTAAVALGDVVDQLLNDDRLADAGAAEQTDLAALDERSDEIDDLDARLEDFGLRLEVDEVGTLAMDRPAGCVLGDRRTVVDRLAEHVEDAAERVRADRDRDRAAGVDHFHSANDGIGRRHGDGADLVAADVLLHLGHDANLVAVGRLGADVERVVELGQVLRLELDVEHRADDLDDLADVVYACGGCHEIVLM